MIRLPSPKGLLLGIFIASAWLCFLVEAKDVCIKLPRIQVQFICNQPLLQEGFNATEVFEDFFSTQTFAKRQSNQSNANNNINDYQIYVSVGINTAEDVSYNEWYHYRCDLDSNQTLVTVDVRGYNHIYNYVYEELNGFGPAYTFESDKWWMFSAPFESMRLYLSSKVCSDHSFGYFRYSIHEWDESKYPMPELDESDVEPDASNNICGVRRPYTYDKFADNSVRGGGQVVYPSSSILRYDGLPSNNTLSEDAYRQRYELKRSEHGYTYDHDLYKLCEDPSYWAYDDDLEEGEPSPTFWLFAVMVGYFMVFMIKAEFARPLRYEQLPRRTSRNRSNSSSDNNDDDGDDDNNDDNDENHRHTSHQRDGQEIELMTLNNRIV